MLLAGVNLDFPRTAAAPPDCTGAADLVHLQKQRVWRWGVNFNMPPFSFKDPATGRLGGLEIDLARRLTSRMFGCTPAAVNTFIEFVDINFADRMSAITDRRVDAVAEIFAENSDRLTEISFAGCYMSGKPALIANRDCPPVVTMVDLRNRKIAVLEASTGGQIVEQSTPSADAVLLPTVTDCISAVNAGTVDAFWGSLAENYVYLNKPGTTHLKQFTLPLPAEPWKIAIHKDSTGLARFINFELSEMISTGELAMLMNRWFRKTPV